MPTTGYFGVSPFGTSTYGGTHIGQFQVISAEAVSGTRVIVTFNADIDLGYGAILDPTNYTVPGLSVLQVLAHSASAVILVTTAQSYGLYTVSVGEARSTTGVLLDPTHRSVTFTGAGDNTAFKVVGLGPRRVRLLFSAAMWRDSALGNPASYVVQGADGAYTTVIEVLLEQPTDVQSVVLVLGSDLVSTAWYQVRVSSLVKTTNGLALQPAAQSFQFVSAQKTLSLSLDEFSGEVQGGLFGTPAGLVFFSPALEVSIPNSVIEIDEVSVCTTAYDTYRFPTPLDPTPLYTWQRGAPQTALAQTGVSLWAPFPRLTEAKFNLNFALGETFQEVTTGPAIATLQEVWAQADVALLNNPYWTLFALPATGVGFITAKNTSPIPAGPTIVVPLE